MKSRKSIILFFFILISTYSCSFSLGGFNQSEESPYWYSSTPFKVNSSDYWIPFFSTTDIPISLPMRGYTANTRNMFIDLGSYEWFSDWVQTVWEYEIPDIEQNFAGFSTLGAQQESLEYLFNAMSYRLSTMGLSVDYAKTLTPPFEAWVPVVVMDNLTSNGYASSNIKDWIFRSDIVESVLDESFPLIEWKTDLYWFDWQNISEFAELVVTKTENNSFIVVDNEFMSLTDDIIYNIINENNTGSYDLIFPAILFFLKDKKLYYPSFGPIGGLGQIQSKYPSISSWCINGRDQYAFFYGGDPKKPRNSLTTTVLHELGHCIGLPHPHDALYAAMEGGWILDASTISTMTYYSRSNNFDQFDKDLVLNCLALQLWRGYHDDLSHLEYYSINDTQQTFVKDLKASLLSVKNLLRESNSDGLNLLFSSINSEIDSLYSDLGLIRSDNSHSISSFPLEIGIDFIIGERFISEEKLAKNLQDILEERYILPIAPKTVLPTPTYEFNTKVEYTSAEWQENFTLFVKDLMKPDNTSWYDPNSIPPDAWEEYPRQRIFKTIEGFSINGSILEGWLKENPATPEKNDMIHYRFYIFNLGEPLFEETRHSQNKTNETILVLLSVLLIISIRRVRKRN